MVATSSMLAASMRKSSSSTIVSANNSTRAGGLANEAMGIRPTRCGATQAMARRSSWTRRDDVGSLHLDDDLLTGAQSGHVDLGDRRGGNRRLGELREHVLERNAEVVLDGTSHVGERLGWNLVAAALELVDQLGREEALTGGDDLTELDERRTERFSGEAQASRQVGDTGRAGSSATAAPPHPREHGGRQPPGDGEAASPGRQPGRCRQRRHPAVGGVAHPACVAQPRDRLAVEHPRGRLGESSPREIRRCSHRLPSWRSRRRLSQADRGRSRLA